MVFTHPSLDAYDDYTKVWASLCQADVDQYFKDRSGPLAFASAR